MRVLRILTRKELNAYFLNPFGWVVLAIVTLMQGLSLSLYLKVEFVVASIMTPL